MQATILDLTNGIATVWRVIATVLLCGDSIKFASVNKSSCRCKGLHCASVTIFVIVVHICTFSANDTICSVIQR